MILHVFLQDSTRVYRGIRNGNPKFFACNGALGNYVESDSLTDSARETFWEVDGAAKTNHTG
jgi:hypothetical protein